MAYYQVEVKLNSQAITAGLPSPQSVSVTLPNVGPKGDAGPTGPSGASEWSEIANRPSEFPPEPHAHDASAITSGVFNHDQIPRYFKYVLLDPPPSSPFLPTFSELGHTYYDLRIPNGSGPNDTYVIRLPQSNLGLKYGERTLICGEMKTSSVGYTRPVRIEVTPSAGSPAQVIFSFAGNPTSGFTSFSALIENGFTGWASIPFPTQVENKLSKNQPQGYAGLDVNGKLANSVLDIPTATTVAISSWIRGTTGDATITTSSPHGFKDGASVAISGTVRTSGAGPIIDGTWTILFSPSSTQFVIAVPTGGLNSSGTNGTATVGGLMTANDKLQLNNAAPANHTHDEKQVVYTAVNPVRTDTAVYIGNSTTFGANFSAANRHLILAPIQIPRLVTLARFLFRVGSTGWSSDGPVLVGLYNTGADGLPQTRLIQSSLNSSSGWLANSVQESDLLNIPVSGGPHWLAFLNMTGASQQIGGSGISNASVINRLLGSNPVLTGGSPESLTTFIAVASGSEMPTDLSALVFQHSINTASSTTLRYRVTAPALMFSYV